MISIILSTNNEIRNGYLTDLLERISRASSSHEIIAIDNDSSDETRTTLERYGARVTILPHSNRAERLSLGISQAKGETILLHHSTSLLPKSWDESINTAIEHGAGWGGFHHRFDYEHPFLRFTSWYSNEIRAKRKSILYLDHMIFAKKDLLNDVGGVPNMDIFEDTVLSYRLERYGGKPYIITDHVVTSARRFGGKNASYRTILKQAIKNQYLKILFYLHKSHKKMNYLYEAKDGYNVTYTHYDSK